MNTSSSRLDMSVVIPRLQWVLVFLGLVLTFVLAFRLRLPDFNWQIALGGWSAIDWVAHLRFPDRYILDFPNGGNVYDKSTVMYLYPFLSRAFEIPVENIIPAMIFMEMAFLAGTSIFFVRTLSGTAFPVGGFLFALLVVGALFSYFRQRSLGRRLALFSTILPIAILANMTRILVLIFAAMAFGQNWAIGDAEKEVSAFHELTGILVFLVALLLLQAASWLLDRLCGGLGFKRARVVTRQVVSSAP